jgi:hypothetical protein
LKNRQAKYNILGAVLFLTGKFAALGKTAQAEPLGYSVGTPRPINPAESTTNPSAQTTQGQNPYLGSVPQKSTGTTLGVSMRDAIECGLRYNLGPLNRVRPAPMYERGVYVHSPRCCHKSRQTAGRLSKPLASKKSD